MNAVQTHIEHFIGTNPLLASTSCTDPVNNLKNLSKPTHSKTPRIVLNLTAETDQPQRTQIRSRSPSPYWIKGETSAYSEVVKTGHVSRNNSRSVSPESKHVKGQQHTRISRKSNFNLLGTPSRRTRSKSPKDKWRPDECENVMVSAPLDPVLSTPTEEESAILGNNNLGVSRETKRRSRSRRNRSAKNNFENEPVTVVTRTSDTDHTVNKSSSSKPEIIVSDVKNQEEEDHGGNVGSENNHPSPVVAIVETFTQTDNRPTTDDRRLLAANTVPPLNPNGSFSKSRLSLTNVSNTDSCFDLNERLMDIFGSVDKKHYRHHRVFDRPRSKSDTRDLNELTQIFTSPKPDDKYTCRFERSAESVKNNSDNRDSTSGRRSFDNILTPFGGNTRNAARLDGTGDEHDESVRRSFVGV